MKNQKSLAIVTAFIPLVIGAWLLGLGELAAAEPTTHSSMSTIGRRSHAGKVVSPVLVHLRSISNDYGLNLSVDKQLAGTFQREELEASQAMRHMSSGAPVPPALLHSFDSLDIGDSEYEGVPNSHLAVGRNHVIVVVNEIFAVYDDSGNILAGPTRFHDLGCLGYHPKVLYDEEADRFVLTNKFPTGTFCIAVTTSSDPTATWYVYTLPLEHDFNEHSGILHTGVGQEAIFAGETKHRFRDYPESQLYAIDKLALYAGRQVSARSIEYNAQYEPQPLHLHGYLQGTWPDGNAHYFVGHHIRYTFKGWEFDPCIVTLVRWPDALHGGLPKTAGSHDLCATTGITTEWPVGAPQLGGLVISVPGLQFDSLEYRNGHAWAAETVSCNAGDDIVNCIRWMEFDLMPSLPALVQSGVFSSTDAHRGTADLAVNHCNDMVVGYNKFSSSTYPSVWFNGRRSSDPVGTLGAEVLLKEGETTYVGWNDKAYYYPWGKYNNTTVDPDGSTFWQIGEYAKLFEPERDTNWGNYVGMLRYDSCPQFALTPYNSVIHAGPDSIGRSITHHFRLSNSLDHTERFSVSLSPGTWNATLLTTSPVTVEPGTAVTVSIQVDVPDEQESSDTFSLLATQFSEPGLWAPATGTTTTFLKAGAEISSNLLLHIGEPGSTLTYTLTIVNTGNYTDTFDVAVDTFGWPVTSQYSETPAMGPGERMTNEIYVVVGEESDANTVTVTFTSSLDPAVSRSVSLYGYHRLGRAYLPVLQKASSPNSGQ